MTSFKNFVVSISLIGAACSVMAAENQWHERWAHVYSGHNVRERFPTSNYGVETAYEFDNQMFVVGHYAVIKEKSGGTDNNALYQHGILVGGGYSFNVRADSKLQLGYLYSDISVKNVEMGGVRVGSYQDQHLYGSGPLARVVHRITPKLTADASLTRLGYTRDVTINYSQLGVSYDFMPSVYGRLGYNTSKSSSATIHQWIAAVGYRF